MILVPMLSIVAVSEPVGLRAGGAIAAEVVVGGVNVNSGSVVVLGKPGDGVSDGDRPVEVVMGAPEPVVTGPVDASAVPLLGVGGAPVG